MGAPLYEGVSETESSTAGGSTVAANTTTHPDSYHNRSDMGVNAMPAVDEPIHKRRKHVTRVMPEWPQITKMLEFYMVLIRNMIGISNHSDELEREWIEELQTFTFKQLDGKDQPE